MVNGINNSYPDIFRSLNSEQRDSITIRVMGQKLKPDDVGYVHSQFKNAAEQAEQVGVSYKKKAKCARIASRIINGDNVPSQDDKFLLENQPLVHAQAWQLRQAKENAKNHGSELNGSDVNGNNGNNGGSLSNAIEIPSIDGGVPDVSAPDVPSIDFTC